MTPYKAIMLLSKVIMPHSEAIMPTPLGVVQYVTADMMESDASFFAWNAPKMVSFGRQIIVVFGVIMVFSPWLAIIP